MAKVAQLVPVQNAINPEIPKLTTTMVMWGLSALDSKNYLLKPARYTPVLKSSLIIGPIAHASTSMRHAGSIEAMPVLRIGA